MHMLIVDIPDIVEASLDAVKDSRVPCLPAHFVCDALGLVAMYGLWSWDHCLDQQPRMKQCQPISCSSWIAGWQRVRQWAGEVGQLASHLLMCSTMMMTMISKCAF
jgi:hypothetical protein